MTIFFNNNESWFYNLLRILKPSSFYYKITLIFFVYKIAQQLIMLFFNLLSCEQDMKNFKNKLLDKTISFMHISNIILYLYKTY